MAMMADWFTEEAARLVKQWERANWPDHGPLGLAKSCLRAGDDHGYRRGLREAIEVCAEVAARWATFHTVAPGAVRECVVRLRALADASDDSGQGG